MIMSSMERMEKYHLSWTLMRFASIRMSVILQQPYCRGGRGARRVWWRVRGEARGGFRFCGERYSMCALACWRRCWLMCVGGLCTHQCMHAFIGGFC